MMHASDPTGNVADVAIVGAGIIGLSLALQLQLDGLSVELIDAEEPASGASYGNAGYLSPTNIVPPASPDMIRAMPRLMLDQEGPLVVRPSGVTSLIPWGLKVLRAAQPHRQSKSIEALVALCQHAIPSFDPLLAAAKASDLLEERGALMVCATQATLDVKSATIARLRDNGFAVERLDAAETRALEPALTKNISGALFYPGNARCKSPGALGRRFADTIRKRGGTIHRGRAMRVFPVSDGWQVDVPEGQSLKARQLVIAAGRWSDSFLKPLGYHAPLISERGYHLMLPKPEVTLSRPVVLAERYFAATPMLDGLRLAGTVEFASTTAPMNPRRADMLFDLAKHYLPGLSRDGANRWMGIRPSLPDGVPAIGRGHHRGLYYSFGHHHMGLTLAAVSAQLLADMITGRPPVVDPEPYDLTRFRGRQWGSDRSKRDAGVEVT